MGYASICYSEGMEDLSQYPWLHMRGSTYYLRVPVPQDIQKSFGRPEVWKSLRTKDRQTAVRRLRTTSPEYLAMFDAHRREQARLAEPPLEELSADQIRLIGDAYYAHLLEEDEELREGGFEGVDFEAHERPGFAGDPNS